jgi:hypothetical protein
MKALQLILACLLITVMATAQLPTLQWARNIGGARGDNVKVDAAGNVYTTGYFGGVADFDPGPATFYLTADGGADDAYVSKLDINGNFLWAVQLGGSNINYNFSVDVDGSGNVYSVGYFAGTVDFDPGPGVFNLTAIGQYDVSVSKLDANGNFVWAKNIGGANSDLAFSVLIDQSNNVCITGNFIGVVDFDPGPDVANLDANGVFPECFILRLDANGNFIWAKEIDGYYGQGNTITKDVAGNLYVCGEFNQTVDLDPGPGLYNVTSAGAADGFVIKLDPTGNFIWGRSFGGPGSQSCESVKTDAAGNVYITGAFPLTVDFDPGAAVFNITAVGASDAYLLKLDAAGNFVWAKAFVGSDADNANDLAVDALGNIYVTGLFQATTDFDPGPAVYNLTSLGSNDIYIVKLDAAGNFGWAVRFGGATLDAGLSLFAASTGNIYATGFFNGVVDFDPGPGVTTLNYTTGATFIVNLGSGVLPLTLIDFSGTAVTVGNILQWKTAQEINSKDFIIEWSDNGINFKNIGQLPATGNSSTIKNYSYLHTTSIEGDNYYRLKMQDINGSYTYSAIITIHKKTTTASITVFPNPVVDQLQLHIKASKNETISFYLHNAEGKLVSARSVNLTSGSNMIRWDMRSMAAGKYFISSSHQQFNSMQVIKN